MLESKFKSDIRKEFKAKGWVFIQLDPGGGVPMGFPDTLVLSPTGYHCFVEWKKSRTAKRQPLQLYWNIKLNDMLQDSFFVYPEMVDDWKQYVFERDRGEILVDNPRELNARAK